MKKQTIDCGKYGKIKLKNPKALGFSDNSKNAAVNELRVVSFVGRAFCKDQQQYPLWRIYAFISQRMRQNYSRFCDYYQPFAIADNCYTDPNYGCDTMLSCILYAVGNLSVDRSKTTHLTKLNDEGKPMLYRELVLDALEVHRAFGANI